MEDRLAQCLHEIMFCDDCPSELRQVLQNVLDLDARISAYDASGFDEYLQSADFAGDVYELFDVDIFEGSLEDDDI